MRILVVDDNETVRRFVTAVLRHKSYWEICGYAADGREAISKVSELSPDVVILDLSMPVMNGFEAAKEIRRVAPSTRIVIYSMYDVPAIGTVGWADAFVTKTAPVQELIAAVERVVGQPPSLLSKRKSA